MWDVVVVQSQFQQRENAPYEHVPSVGKPDLMQVSSFTTYLAGVNCRTALLILPDVVFISLLCETRKKLNK